MTSSNAVQIAVSAIISATEGSKIALIKSILRKTPAAVNAMDWLHLTPLQYAAMEGNKAVTELLVQSGADVNIRQDIEGMTALHYAAQLDAPDIAKLLIDHGADVNIKDHYGDTPLHRAVMNRKRDTVDLLIANGAEIDSRQRNGATPLFYAAFVGDVELTEVLCRRGADVRARIAGATRWENVSIPSGTTPLEVAVLRGHQDVSRFLRGQGA